MGFGPVGFAKCGAGGFITDGFEGETYDAGHGATGEDALRLGLRDARSVDEVATGGTSLPHTPLVLCHFFGGSR